MTLLRFPSLWLALPLLFACAVTLLTYDLPEGYGEGITLLASCAGDGAGGGGRQLLGARLRGGNAAPGRGAGSFVT